MPKFTPEQRAWIDDLKTTTAPQTKCNLQDTHGFCCLGRGLEALGIAPKDRIQGVAYYENGTPDGEDTVLPPAAAERLGLRSTNGHIDRSKLPSNSPWSKEFDRHPRIDTLWKLNDDLQWPFEKIGRFIEDNPTAVFKTQEPA